MGRYKGYGHLLILFFLEKDLQLEKKHLSKFSHIKTGESVGKFLYLFIIYYLSLYFISLLELLREEKESF